MKKKRGILKAASTPHQEEYVYNKRSTEKLNKSKIGFVDWLHLFLVSFLPSYKPTFKTLTFYNNSTAFLLRKMLVKQSHSNITGWWWPGRAGINLNLFLESGLLDQNRMEYIFVYVKQSRSWGKTIPRSTATRYHDHPRSTASSLRYSNNI